VESRIASVGVPASLDRAIAGAAAVINCAGPFGDTAPPLIEAALRAGIHYLDVTGEALVAMSTFDTYRDDPRPNRQLPECTAPMIDIYAVVNGRRAIVLRPHKAVVVALTATA
jgi:hypothetical protein